MALDQVFHIDATQLGTLRELRSGSRGRILQAPAALINQRWPALYKEYHPQVRDTLDIDALQGMVGLVAELGDETERWLFERAAWPTAVVTRDGAPSGYLMCQAPAGLVAASEVLAGRPGYLDEPAIRESIGEAEAIMAALHGWDVTLGQLDPHKLLLRQPAHSHGQPACYLLGCDRFQWRGRAIVPAADVPAADVPPTDVPPANPARGPGTDRAVLAELARDLVGRLPQPPDRAVEPGLDPRPPAPIVAPVLDETASGVTDTVRPRRSRSRFTLLAGTLAILVAGGVVGGVVLLRGGSRHASVSAATSPSPVPPASANASPSPAPSASVPLSLPPTSVGLVDVSAVVADTRAGDIGRLFNTYFSAINARNFDGAVQLYDPSGIVNPNDPKQRQSFADAVRTTTDSAVVLVSLGPGDGQATQIPARITFVSQQQAGYGPKGRANETCTRWDVTYLLRSPAPHDYRIVRGTANSNRPC